MKYEPRNHFDEHNKWLESARKSMEENLEKLNDCYIFEDGESPMDYAKRIEESLNSSLPELKEMVDVLKAQSEYIKSISESAISQAESAKKVANQSNLHSWVAVGISALTLLLEVLVNHITIIEILNKVW